MNIFTAYGDKSGAKRGFGRAFPQLIEATDSYLQKLEGKWGFYKNDDGNPVTIAETNFSATANSEPGEAPADLNVLNDMAPKGPMVADQALEAAKEENEDEAPPAPDAFSRFAFGQLTAGSNTQSEQAAAPGASPSPAPIQRNRPESNGVKKPSAGTACARVWDIATGLSNQGGESKTARLMDVVKAAEAAGINKFTARTQYARWRVFHGITGRVA